MSTELLMQLRVRIHQLVNMPFSECIKRAQYFQSGYYCTHTELGRRQWVAQIQTGSDSAIVRPAQEKNLLIASRSGLKISVVSLALL